MAFEQHLHEERAQAMGTSWERASRHMEEAGQRPWDECALAALKGERPMVAGLQ